MTHTRLWELTGKLRLFHLRSLTGRRKVNQRTAQSVLRSNPKQPDGLN